MGEASPNDPNEARDLWILTSTGKQFYLAQPDAALIDIEDIARTLANICRFNGRTRTFYSVAQHSILVAEICTEDPLAGLLHDASEAYLGDVIRPLKKAFPGISEIEAGITREICRAVGVGYERLVHPRIKQADRIALATEIRDLMPAWPENAEPLPEPVARQITPLDPELARRAFLDLYEELNTHCRRGR